MPRSPVRLVALVLAAIALGSCSYAYELLAVVIGGKPAFIVDPVSDSKPECINGITVSVDKGEPARAEPNPGDNEKLVENGIYWWKSLVPDCENSFPIFYGQPLKGKRLVYGEGVPEQFRGEASSLVEAKPLQVGAVYEVTTTSGATGYGSGWFRITADRRVENWHDDPTPAVRNEQGYDVSGPYEAPPPATLNRP